jgi:uncharacterized pyridoxamine 5'-phosphate oxidase family protein
VRPFGALDVFEGKIYFQTGKKKDVSKQMARNPKVEICAMDGPNWIRITAKAIRDDRLEAQEHMLESNPNLRSLYKVGDGNTEVLYLKDVTATIFVRGEEPKVITW